MLHYCQVFWFGVRRVWCGLPSVPGFHLARVHGPKQKDELEITTQINPILHVIFNGATCPILMFSCGLFVCSSWLMLCSDIWDDVKEIEYDWKEMVEVGTPQRFDPRVDGQPWAPQRWQAVKARIAEGFCSAARVPFVEFAVAIFSYFFKARSRVDEGGADAKLAAERAHLAGQFQQISADSILVQEDRLLHDQKWHRYIKCPPSQVGTVVLYHILVFLVECSWMRLIYSLLPHEIVHVQIRIVISSLDVSNLNQHSMMFGQVDRMQLAHFILEVVDFFWKTSHLDLFKNCLKKFQVKDEILREGPLSRCLDGTLGFGSFLLATPHWALSCLTDRFPRKRGGGHEHHEPWNLDVYEEWDQPILLVGAFAAGRLKWPREAVGTWLQDIVTVVIGELNKSFSQIKRELERNHHDGVAMFFFPGKDG